VIGSDEVKEGGLAELIEGSEGNRKYLALHRTAKVGTILKVRNELNNREVFVRVAGPLPNTGVNTNVVIKISKSAYDRLGAIDQRFRVEVTYYK
jgi:rare lipoprotein A (peptidoglycan hydrolase)